MATVENGNDYKALQVSEETREAALKVISTAKAQIIGKDKVTFLIAILFRLKIVISNEINTMATNNIKIWVNPQFIMSASKDLRIFGLLHEVLHVAYSHTSRLEDRDRTLWNYACDYVVNGDLKQAGLYCPDWAYHDQKFYGKSAEEIYDILYEELEDDGKGKGTGKGQYLTKAETASQHPDAFGEDLLPDDKESVDDPRQPHEEPLSAEERQAAVDELISDAATQAELTDTWGSVPANIKRMIEAMRKPKLNWRIVLKRFMFALDKNRTTWRKPNKRLLPLYLPTRDGHKLGNIMFAIDVSGSISEDMFFTFASEVYSVLNVLKPKQIDLIQFDSRICGVDVVRKKDELYKVEFKGGGGTELEPVMHHFIESKATALVVLTDGYFSHNITQPKNPVVWCVYDNPSWLAPFGSVVHFSSK